jgi:site-specific DNA-methyltransferase (adenine-specific)
MSSERFAVHVGDNLPILKTLPDNSVDAIVTDPPAGISMMGKDWDSDKGGRDKWIEWMSEVAAECLRVIKPGGHALVWATWGSGLSA